MCNISWRSLDYSREHKGLQIRVVSYHTSGHDGNDKIKICLGNLLREDKSLFKVGETEIIYIYINLIVLGTQ
jgi:hypothetical protein